MAILRSALFAGCVLLAGLAASAASAGTVTITDVETGNGNLGNVSVGSYGSPWTTPILLTDSGGHTYVVFCDDLQHVVDVGGGQDLAYHIGLVTTDGNGDPISEVVSNEMGQLADIGRYDYSHGNEDGALAAQAEIWNIEYKAPVSSSDPTIEADIKELASTIKYNGGGYATGLIADGGTQSFVMGGGVPEPATWAMLMFGVAMIGGSARRRNAGVALAT
jgi:hypothetical protein